jgi:hypothetical protein
MPRTTIRIYAEDNAILVACRYEDREKVKTVDGYRWDGTRRCWVFPQDAETAIRLTSLFSGVPVDVDETIQEYVYTASPEQLATAMRPKAEITVYCLANEIRIKSQYRHKDLVTAGGSCRWDADRKEWIYPKSVQVAKDLVQSIGGRGISVECDDEFTALYSSTSRLDAAAAVLQTEELENIPGCARSAWRHQREAYWYISNLWGLSENT